MSSKHLQEQSWRRKMEGREICQLKYLRPPFTQVPKLMDGFNMPSPIPSIRHFKGRGRILLFENCTSSKLEQTQKCSSKRKRSGVLLGFGSKWKEFQLKENESLEMPSASSKNRKGEAVQKAVCWAEAHHTKTVRSLSLKTASLLLRVRVK